VTKLSGILGQFPLALAIFLGLSGIAIHGGSHRRAGPVGRGRAARDLVPLSANYPDRLLGGQRLPRRPRADQGATGGANAVSRSTA
jgi:hypothetical protein